MHDRDTIRHHHGFFLMMWVTQTQVSPGLFLDGFQLDLHRLPQLLIQGRQRLVEQPTAGLLTSALASATRCCSPPRQLPRHALPCRAA